MADEKGDWDFIFATADIIDEADRLEEENAELRKQNKALLDMMIVGKTKVMCDECGHELENVVVSISAGECEYCKSVKNTRMQL